MDNEDGKFSSMKYATRCSPHALFIAAACASVAMIGAHPTALAQKKTTSSVNVKINGSDGPVTVINGTVAYLSWTSQNVSACSYVAKVGSTVVASGSTATSASDVPTPAITFPLTFEFTCTTTDWRPKTVTDSATVAPTQDPNPFTNLQQVTVLDYNGENDTLMEPFLSRDERFMFFNNSNDPTVNTNLYYATRVDATTFQFKGEVLGVNDLNPDPNFRLEAGPTMDTNGRFYFTTNQTYAQNLISTHAGTLTEPTDGTNLTVTNPGPVSGLSPVVFGWITMDTGVSPDGNLIYYANAQFSGEGPPSQAIINVAAKTGDATFDPLSNSGTLMAKVNTGGLNYAAEISEDGLELYFTRTDLTQPPQIYVARRSNTNDPFSTIQLIVAAEGFVEGATIGDQGRRIYFHKMTKPADANGPAVFKLFTLTRN